MTWRLVTKHLNPSHSLLREPQISSIKQTSIHTVTNVLYTYRQNTTVVLDVVYLLVLRYMFRHMLGHDQALWRYIV
jgi:hypothetical protein